MTPTPTPTKTSLPSHFYRVAGTYDFQIFPGNYGFLDGTYTYVNDSAIGGPVYQMINNYGTHAFFYTNFFGANRFVVTLAGDSPSFTYWAQQSSNNIFNAPSGRYTNIKGNIQNAIIEPGEFYNSICLSANNPDSIFNGTYFKNVSVGSGPENVYRYTASIPNNPITLRTIHLFYSYNLQTWALSSPNEGLLLINALTGNSNYTSLTSVYNQFLPPLGLQLYKSIDSNSFINLYITSGSCIVSTPTPTPTPSVTPTATINNVLLNQARDEVAIVYNQNSNDSIAVANYYKNNRPYFNEVRTIALDIPLAIYPARINSDGSMICVSGCDIDSPYEGCRKYDFISQDLAITNIQTVLSTYKINYPSTKYFIFMIDVPTLTVPNTAFNVPSISATQAPSLSTNVTGIVRNGTGITPFYITGALSADCVAYIDKLKTGISEGLTLTKLRNRIYTEDSWGAGYDNLNYYQSPELNSSLSANTIYRSGGPNPKTSGQQLTGIFMDQSGVWPYNTGNIPISSLAIWGSWGFNGRRIQPPYTYVDSLSINAWYLDPRSPGKLSFVGNDNGWYYCHTMESWCGAPHGGSYGYFGGGSVGNKFWGGFPATYTGVKDFNAFKSSSEFTQGLRPLRHSCYTQYFSKSAFGGTNYQYTPIIFIGNTSEPGYPGSVGGTNWFQNWYNGSTAYETVTAAVSNSFRMLVIGDPLVKITNSSLTPTPTPTITPTPSLTPINTTISINNQNLFINPNDNNYTILVTNNVSSFNLFLNNNEYCSLLTNQSLFSVSAYNLNNITLSKTLLNLKDTTVMKTSDDFYYYTLTFVNTGSIYLNLNLISVDPPPNYFIESFRLSACAKITNLYFSSLSVI